MNRFVGGRKAVWGAIEALAAKGGRKTAAIAWVSSSNRISFGTGDRLVVDASDHAVRQGLTSAEVLRQAADDGAELRSRPGLHAKVMVIGRTLVVGSMNASKRSDGRLAEAATLTTDLDAVASGLGWVEDLFDASEEIDEDFLKRIEGIDPVKRLPLEGGETAGRDVP
jgi:phosphatidylserine/phosphatidylglycerophosphate/cardiolipin synthase-like enzyme